VLTTVLEAMDAAEQAGLTPVKINVVVMAGINDDEIVDLAALARDTGRVVRFIEFMPLDADETWERSKVVPGEEILARINAVLPLEPASERALDAVRRRLRRDRCHHERDPRVLWLMQPPPAHRGRGHPQLLVRQ
jgi:cyclic pyranopterin phosphate synthase